MSTLRKIKLEEKVQRRSIITVWDFYCGILKGAVLEEKPCWPELSGRVWFGGGRSVLDFPRRKTTFSSYLLCQRWSFYLHITFFLNDFSALIGKRDAINWTFRNVVWFRVISYGSPRRWTIKQNEGVIFIHETKRVNGYTTQLCVCVYLRELGICVFHS